MFIKNKISIILIILGSSLLFSCSLYDQYMELRENPVYKEYIVAAPENFYGITGTSQGYIILCWGLIENAVEYEIYYSDFILGYTCRVPYEENKEARVEVSGLPYGTTNFFIKSVSASGIKSTFSSKYVSAKNSSKTTSSKLIFRKL